MSRFLWIYILITIPTVFAQSPEYNEIAIINVTVIPMDSKRLLFNQTVLIKEGIISTIGQASKIRIPMNAIQVDGKGNFLMPGLVDMHVHIASGMFPLFLANGVTTVRNMWGTEGTSYLRKLISERKLLGPTIYSTGSIIDGANSRRSTSEVETAEQAKQLIIYQKNAGWEFVKVYDKLSKEVYETIIATAKQFDMPVVGHVPFAVGLERVLQSEQKSIEHLTGYTDLIKVSDNSDNQAKQQPKAGKKHLWIDEQQLQFFVQETRKYKVWNCPTLVLINRDAPSDIFQRLKSRSIMRYLSPHQRLSRPLSSEKSELYYHQLGALKKRIVKALYKGGAKLLLGTDVGMPMVIPGFSIHEELQLLVDAGLSPYDALKTGTHDAAEFLRALDSFGTVAIGKRADLILLKANPLKKISNTQQIRGVVVKGQWLSEKRIQQMLEGVAARYKKKTY